jgi:hypothetical protein
MTKADLTFDSADDRYLAVDIRGDRNSVDMKATLTSIRDQAAELGATRILIEGRNFAAPRTMFDRYVSGTIYAELFVPPIKVALLYRSDDITGFTEDTAVNRGADFATFGSQVEALNWLLVE